VPSGCHGRVPEVQRTRRRRTTRTEPPESVVVANHGSPSCAAAAQSFPLMDVLSLLADVAPRRAAGDDRIGHLRSLDVRIGALLWMAVLTRFWIEGYTMANAGNLCPGIIIATRPYRIAVRTDLTLGDKSWPVIKIVNHPLGRTRTSPCEVGALLPVVPLYYERSGLRHWADGSPCAPACLTDDFAAIERACRSIPGQEGKLCCTIGTLWVGPMSQDSTICGPTVVSSFASAGEGPSMLSLCFRS
jgi:hypothetical protein